MHEPHHAAAAAREQAIRLVLDLGEALHRFGLPAHRSEEALEQVCRTLGLSGSFFFTPTYVAISFGEPAEGRVCMVRVEPGAVDLGKLYALYRITDDIVERKLDLSEATQKLYDVMHQTEQDHFLVSLLCFGTSSGAASIFFGGHPSEVMLSSFLGLWVGLVATLSVRSRAFSQILEPLAASVSALLAAILASFSPYAVSPQIMTLASIVVLLPGLSFTTAMNELATQHLASGTARLAGAMVQLLRLGFGVVLGSKIAVLLPIPLAVSSRFDWPPSAIFFAVVCAALSFAVLLRARWQDAPLIVVSCLLAILGSRLGATWLGPALGAFVGALLVAGFSNLHARLRHRPAVVVLVPGILVLVPGSLGFRSVFAVLENSVATAAEAAVAMISVAIALVGGLLLANAALPTRRPL